MRNGKVKVLTEAEARERLRVSVRAAGGASAFARLAGFSGPFVSEALNGNRGLTDRLLAAIGLEKVEPTYRELKK